LTDAKVIFTPREIELLKEVNELLMGAYTRSFYGFKNGSIDRDILKAKEQLDKVLGGL